VTQGNENRTQQYQSQPGPNTEHDDNGEDRECGEKPLAKLERQYGVHDKTANHQSRDVEERSTLELKLLHNQKGKRELETNREEVTHGMPPIARAALIHIR
jgi:hypothetical protein